MNKWLNIDTNLQKKIKMAAIRVREVDKTLFENYWNFASNVNFE